MADSQKLVGMAGLFDDPDALLHAAEQVRDAGWKKWDCHTPYPVHGLDGAMGIRPSPIPYVCIGAGLFGAASAMLMQWWMSAVDFPVRIGGLGVWHSPLHDSGIMAEITSSRFAVVLDAADEHFQEDEARRLLAAAGSKDVRPVYENEEEDEAFL
jgi:hypothetical protein